jgi:hypothetical protein
VQTALVGDGEAQHGIEKGKAKNKNDPSGGSGRVEGLLATLEVRSAAPEHTRHAPPTRRAVVMMRMMVLDERHA